MLFRLCVRSMKALHRFSISFSLLMIPVSAASTGNLTVTSMLPLSHPLPGISPVCLCDPWRDTDIRLPRYSDQIRPRFHHPSTGYLNQQ